jgi:hypothetical protein
MELIRSNQANMEVEFEKIKFEGKESMAIITLNQFEKLNPFCRSDSPNSG